MKIKEKHNLNGETFREQIEHQFESNQAFISNVNRDLIMELAFRALDDADLKNAIYEVIITDELASKQEKARELLSFYLDEDSQLKDDAGLDINTDQAILAYKLIILTNINLDVDFSWEVEVNFGNNYSHPIIMVEKI
jgi:hypothetical protein